MVNRKRIMRIMKEKNTICLYCETNPIEMKRRPLCKTCYSELHKAGLLNDVPLIDASDEFKSNLIRKYGKEILTDFNVLIQQKELTLSKIATKYQFSREYARLIFGKLYKFHYTVIKKQRTSERKTKLEITKQLMKDPRSKFERCKNLNSVVGKGILAEKMALEICIKLGYEVKPFTNGKEIDLVINGYKVDIKGAYCSTLTNPGSKTKVFHFHRSESQKIADFIACYAEPINKFFIIPNGVFPNSNHLFIPEKPEHDWVWHGDRKMYSKSKWYQYLEAWYLLKKEPKEIVFSSSLSEQSVAIG